jgi:hypothetical protein
MSKLALALTLAAGTAVPAATAWAGFEGRLITLAQGAGSRTFRLKKEIGRGKWSVTHEARDVINGERFAIKLTKPERADTGFQDTFDEEAALFAKVSHPNLMHVLGIGHSPGGRRALVMQHISGRTVRDLFLNQVQRPSPLAVRIAIEALQGVAALHEAGIVHRRLHTGNVMYDATHDHVTVVDMGASRPISAEEPAAKDILDIGKLLAFMLTGVKGNGGGQRVALAAPMHVLPDIAVKTEQGTLHLGDVIVKATHTDPDQRYSSPREFIRALEPFRSSLNWLPIRQRYQPPVVVAPPAAKPRRADDYAALGVKTFDLTQPGKPAPTIVFLPGGSQPADNPVIRRLTEGLKAQGVSAVVHSLPTQQQAFDVPEFLRHQSGPLFLAGHGGGGGARMFDLARQTIVDEAGVRGAILVSTFPGASASTPSLRIPTLVLRGSNDENDPMEHAGPLVKVLTVKGGDHSLRFRTHGTPREQADASPETAALNRAVAKAIGSFLDNPWQSTLDDTHDVAGEEVAPTTHHRKRPVSPDLPVERL